FSQDTTGRDSEIGATCSGIRGCEITTKEFAGGRAASPAIQAIPAAAATACHRFVSRRDAGFGTMPAPMSRPGVGFAMSRRLILIAALLATGGLHPRLATAADDPLPPGAALRLGDTRFLAGGPVERLEFSPDARHLTAWAVPAGSRDARLKTTWDAATWQPVRTTEDVQLVGAVVRWQPTSIPDSTRGVVVNLDGVAVVRDFETGKDVVRLTGHYSRVTAVAVSADGKRIATGAADGLVRVWD